MPNQTAKINKTDKIQFYEDMKHHNSHTLLVGMQNGLNTLTKGLAISYKTKHTSVI